MDTPRTNNGPTQDGNPGQGRIPTRRESRKALRRDLKRSTAVVGSEGTHDEQAIG